LPIGKERRIPYQNLNPYIIEPVVFKKSLAHYII
jgi:hypothetical protein